MTLAPPVHVASSPPNLCFAGAPVEKAETVVRGAARRSGGKLRNFTQKRLHPLSELVKKGDPLQFQRILSYYFS